MMAATTLTARWALGGYADVYPWSQCKYCGRAADRDCTPADCLLCGSRQCNSRGECWICTYGWLPNWSRGYGDERNCGYRGCNEPAVASAPRVKQVCTAHAERAKVNGRTLVAYAAGQITERDAGKLAIGRRRWQWVA